MGLSKIRTKVRALSEDLSKSDSESFIYENSKLFSMAESNIISITKVEVNGANYGSGNWDFDSATNILEVTGSLSSDDVVKIYYTYYKRSDTIIDGFVEGALVYISLYSTESESDYELETDEIQPTPSNKTEDLIALIASILINPNWNEYRLPNITVRYPRTMSKEDRITKLINRYNRGIGLFSTLDWD